MSVNAHIQQLEQKHRNLESTLSDLVSSPSAHDKELIDIKRQKLRLKDEIERLKLSRN